MSEVNFTCLVADLENVCTALMTLAQEGHMSAEEYNAFNGQIFYMEEKVQEIQAELEELGDFEKWVLSGQCDDDMAGDTDPIDASNDGVVE